ncbi:hypothetical protein [Calothrix sp. 336/3]|uniref:hypothetical protein n=1 Tax=Calothrix sp. 336/3 TaxID=1337936 RepID=UPI000B2635A9|nr:hypothetical protein [Calothrix sp. 336/3]
MLERLQPNHVRLWYELADIGVNKNFYFLIGISHRTTFGFLVYTSVNRRGFLFWEGGRSNEEGVMSNE